MKPLTKPVARRGAFTVKQRVQLEKTKTGPKGRPEFVVSARPSSENPQQQHLEIDVPFASWMIVREDFSDPQNPILEVEELE